MRGIYVRRPGSLSWARVRRPIGNGRSWWSLGRNRLESPRSAHVTARQGPNRPKPDTGRRRPDQTTRAGGSRGQTANGTPDTEAPTKKRVKGRGSGERRRRPGRQRGGEEERRWRPSAPPTSDSRSVRRLISRVAGISLVPHRCWIGFDSLLELAAAAEEVRLEGGHRPRSAGAGPSSRF